MWILRFFFTDEILWCWKNAPWSKHLFEKQLGKVLFFAAKLFLLNSSQNCLKTMFEIELKLRKSIWFEIIILAINYESEIFGFITDIITRSKNHLLLIEIWLDWDVTEILKKPKIHRFEKHFSPFWKKNTSLTDEILEFQKIKRNN